MKKILSIILAMLLLAGVLATGVVAVDYDDDPHNGCEDPYCTICPQPCCVNYPACRTARVDVAGITFASSQTMYSWYVNLYASTATQWTIATSERWISTTVTRGTGNGSFRIRVSANRANADRQGTIYINADCGVVEITVIQFARSASTSSRLLFDRFHDWVEHLPLIHEATWYGRLLWFIFLPFRLVVSFVLQFIDLIYLWWTEPGR